MYEEFRKCCSVLALTTDYGRERLPIERKFNFFARWRFNFLDLAQSSTTQRGWSSQSFAAITILQEQRKSFLLPK